MIKRNLTKTVFTLATVAVDPGVWFSLSQGFLIYPLGLWILIFSTR